MIESKSMFAKRIGRDMRYVWRAIRRGDIILDKRPGFVRVKESLANLERLRRGRKKTAEKKVHVQFRIKKSNVQLFIEFVKKLS